ncbi:MAG: C1 family peptidase [Clostridia bacterium]
MYVNKKYLTEEERNVLSTEKIRLRPWDPMGTLA